MLVFACVSSAGELPPNVAALVSAYSEWVTMAEFVAHYSRYSGLTTVERYAPVPEQHALAQRRDATGEWCKRGQFWRVNIFNDRPLQRIAKPTNTSPGTMKFVDSETLCSGDFTMNYFPQKELVQAGLTARLLDDGALSSQFQPSCLNAVSVLNPFGSEVLNLNTGEWTLPGLSTQADDIEWSVQEADVDGLCIVARWSENDSEGEITECKYTFLMEPNVPVLGAIRKSVHDSEGVTVRYDDIVLSGFKLFQCGAELPSRMENRSFPVSFSNAEGDTKLASRVVVWTLEYPHTGSASDTDLAVDFAVNTVFSGFSNEPAGASDWSLIGFDNRKDTSLVAPRRDSRQWVLTVNAVLIFVAACVWWLRRRRLQQRS